MASFVRIWGGSAASQGVVIVNGSASTGYARRTAGAFEGALGSVVHDPIMSSSIDQSPVKVGQREGSRVFPERWEIVGSSWSDYCTKRDALVAEIRDANASKGAGRLRVRSVSGSFPVEYEIQHVKTGPLTSHAAELSNRHVVDLEFTCSPYALGDPMDVADGFDVDTMGTAGVFNNGGADWTVRSGSTPTIASGYMQVAAGGTAAVVEHTGTPYAIGDNQQTLEFQWTVQANGNASGVVLKRLADGSHLRVIVDDNGTNSTLRIQKVSSGGAATSLGTPVNLGVRVPASTTRWVRGRVEGNVVTAELFTSSTGPMAAYGTAATTYQHTLTSGDATSFGFGAVGASGMVLSPASGSARALSWNRFAYAYTEAAVPISQPIAATTTGPIPGTAPALADVRLSGGYSSVLCAVLAWSSRRAPLTSTVRPFGLVDAVTASGVMAPPTTADASAHGGSVIPGNTGVYITVDGSSLPDGAGDTVLVWVIARIRLSSTVASSTMLAKVSHLAAGTNSSSIEYPSGRVVSNQKPSSGTRFRLVSLGTVALSRSAAEQKISVEGVSASGVADFAIDHVVLVPAAAMGHAGVGTAGVNGSVGAGAPYGYRIASNLAARVDKEGAAGAWDDAGPAGTFLGTRIFVQPGESIDWFALTSTVSIDTTAAAVSGSAVSSTYARFMQIAVQPRYWIGS